MTAFRDFDTADFLRNYWQKQPVLIRDPWREWVNPIEPDDLAGLACEPEVESRLLHRSGEDRWKLEHGPLAPARFADLRQDPWTLLVQAVDHHVPQVAALLEPFRFIPDWRIDDVMVSYAVDGGGVGAHFDQYDVFLVQGLGRRRWRVGQKCDDTTPLLPHDSLRLLAGFEPVAEWVLEPGDMLYVPPGFAHDGVAVGDDCMTYSIGFRAPSRSELLSAWTDHVLDTLCEDDRFADPDLAQQDNPGEIAATALNRVQDMVTAALADRDGFARWFGEYVTQPKNDQLDWSPEVPATLRDLEARAAAGGWLERNPACRFSFIAQSGERVVLFVDGTAYDCEGQVAAFARQLCANTRLAIDPAAIALDDIANIVLELVNRGSVALIAAE